MKKTVLLVGLTAVLTTPPVFASYVQAFSADAQLLNKIVFKTNEYGGAPLDVAGTQNNTSIQFTNAAATTLAREIHVCAVSNQENQTAEYLVEMATDHAGSAWTNLTGATIQASTTTNMNFYDTNGILYDVIGQGTITADVEISQLSKFTMSIPLDDGGHPWEDSLGDGVINATGILTSDYDNLTSMDAGTNTCDFKKVLTVAIDTTRKFPDKLIKGHIRLTGSLT